MRTRSKRMPALLLIAAAILLIVAGCGNSKTNEQGSSSATTAPEAPTPVPKPSKLLGSDKHPVVTIEMDNGKLIKIELYPEIAPNTVNNFISLVKKGFYDGTIFHRVIPTFMIQGGDPEGTGMGGPGYSIKGEFSSNGFENELLHTRGILSMARTKEPDSAGSQFFIMVADAESLDGEYASFGEVIEGMDTVDEIVNQPRGSQDRPTTPLAMKKVTVDTLGVDYPEPETIK